MRVELHTGVGELANVGDDRRCEPVGAVRASVGGLIDDEHDVAAHATG